MQLDDLPRPIMQLILEYKAELDRLLEFHAFFDHVMYHLLYF